jgi:hypothetical protein
MEYSKNMVDNLILLSIKVTDILMGIKEDPLRLELFLKNDITEYLEELETVVQRLSMFPRQDLDHLKFKKMVLPWLVMQSLSYSSIQ